MVADYLPEDVIITCHSENGFAGLAGMAEKGKEDVDIIEEEFKKYNKTYEFHRYDGAGHGIWYYDKPMYRQEAAMDSWNKAFAFFDKYLK